MITRESYLKISRTLEQFHTIFYKVWEMGTPSFTTRIPTACVVWKPGVGKFIGYEFNPEFWANLSDYERAFVICHESLHVILDHGFRSLSLDLKFARILNIAQDLVINHMLINKFLFDRDRLPFLNKMPLCFVDTVFPGEDVPDDETVEYYFNLLLNHPSSKKYNSFDDHSMLPTISLGRELAERLEKELSKQEQKEFNEKVEGNLRVGKEAGKGGDFDTYFANTDKPEPKRKWESIIKDWAKRESDDLCKDDETWLYKDGKHMMMPSYFRMPAWQFMPTLAQVVPVWFFQDTSGSCVGLKDRFFAAAESLPKNKFDIKMHCFSDEVYDVNMTTKELYGFQGTSFEIIEDFIQARIKRDNIPYPKAVFIVTDGWGDSVRPQFPRNWYWILSEDCKQYIPKDSKTFMLEDFE